MKYLSAVTIIFTFLLEIGLIAYYFLALLPDYNKNSYVMPRIEEGASPTCSLFATQNEAQAFYAYYKDSIRNSAQLDHDDDGKVCENLP